MMLKFIQLDSSVEPGFWVQARAHKLSQGLSEAPSSVYGTISPSQGRYPTAINLGSWSFQDKDASVGGIWRHTIPGHLVSLNTLENLKTYDRKALVDNIITNILRDIHEVGREFSPLSLPRWGPYHRVPGFPSPP